MPCRELETERFMIANKKRAEPPSVFADQANRRTLRWVLEKDVKQGLLTNKQLEAIISRDTFKKVADLVSRILRARTSVMKAMLRSKFRNLDVAMLIIEYIYACTHVD